MREFPNKELEKKDGEHVEWKEKERVKIILKKVGFGLINRACSGFT
jgi:hypothetical protein